MIDTYINDTCNCISYTFHDSGCEAACISEDSTDWGQHNFEQDLLTDEYFTPDSLIRLNATRIA